MAAFGTMGRGAHWRKLEKELAREPTAEKAAELIREYMRAGETERALEIARKATSAFPESREIASLLSQAVRLWRRERIANLRTAIESPPANPEAYTELAELLEGAGDANAALQVCVDGLSAFPTSPELHICLGRMRFERFHRNMLARDGIASINALKRALELEPSSAEAALVLIRIYLEVGCAQEARGLLEKVSRLYLRDERVLNLQKALEQALPRPAATAEAAIREVEKSRRFVTDLTDEATEIAPRAPLAGVDMVQSRLEQAAPFAGFLAAVVLDEEQKPVASKVEKQIDAAAVAGAVGQVIAAAEKGSLRMDIGGFGEGVVKTAGGRIYLRNLADGSLAVICGPEARSDAAMDYISALVLPKAS